MTKYNRLIFITIFILFFSLIDVCAVENTKNSRVLFISSYSYSWDPVVMQIEGLKQSIDENVVFDYKFMDMKNIATDESKQLFYEEMKYFLKNSPKYDVIIAGDDNAFEFVMKYQEELFFQIPIVFEGVNHVELVEKEKNNPYVTGIIETLSFDDTIELAYSMYPDAKNVVAILDDTVTGEGGKLEFYKHQEKFPFLRFSQINASKLTKEGLKREVSKLDEESILIFILCSEDADGNIYSSNEAVPMLSEAAQIPIFSVMPIGLGKGVLGGNIVSHEQMGIMAGEMAMQIIEGKNCSEIDIIEKSPKMYCFDEDVIRRFNINRNLIPKQSKILNHQETFVERNKSMIQISIVIFVLLMFMITILILDNIRRRKLNTLMKEANLKLEKSAMYDELTGIRNRAVFIEDLKKTIATEKSFGLIMYDMDDFKKINDIYGHNEGDASLKQMAKRAEEIMDNRITIYRLAGDEFIAIVKSDNRKIIEDYMKRLHNALRKPYNIAGKNKNMSISMGAAVFPDDGNTEVQIIKAVDSAMYYVKKHGKNGMIFYRDGMQMDNNVF